MCSLTPRFIISVRELYAHDVQGTRGEIDTGFGLSFSGRAGETMAFADVEWNEGSGGVEEIPMEVAASLP